MIFIFIYSIILLIFIFLIFLVIKSIIRGVNAKKYIRSLKNVNKKKVKKKNL